MDYTGVGDSVENMKLNIHCVVCIQIIISNGNIIFFSNVSLVTPHKSGENNSKGCARKDKVTGRCLVEAMQWIHQQIRTKKIM